MKFVLSLILCAILADCDALPTHHQRMVYYQQPAQWYAGPQRMMYLQYMQPSRTHARSTQAASTLVAGDSVATGTYLKDCTHEESEIAAAGPAEPSALSDDELTGAGAHVASSVAEAYPEVPEPELVYTNEQPSKVPREYQFEAEQPAASDLPAPKVPFKKYLPAVNRKKVYLQAEQTPPNVEAQATEDDNAVGAPVDAESDDDNEIEQYPLYYPNRKPISSRKPSKGPGAAGGAKPLPAGTFFPISFGGTAGGAIAIANSFSTGEGGTATSHAVAYGSPDAARARVQPIRRH